MHTYSVHIQTLCSRGYVAMGEGCVKHSALLGHMVMHKMWPIATHVAWTARVSVRHIGEMCRNGCTDPGAIWGGDSGAPVNHVLNGGPGKGGIFLGDDVASC